MAIIVPTLEEIDKLKQKPTSGESTLLTFLSNLNDEYTVYFQPFLNGSLPDFIILHRTKGILIIEVKDWNLNLYKISNNHWYVQTSNKPAKVKSPIKQVQDYKEHIFSFIQGFVEDSIHQSSKFGYVQTAVYFHNMPESEALNFCRECREYNRWVTILGSDSLNFDRFRNMHFFRSNLSQDFTNRYYHEFQLLFAPSIHLLELGKEITYSKEQQKLIKSKKGEVKIKGVAGSGKTFVLAKRAVNAQKRTKSRVLILTYNITLRNFIRDKLNQVRDEFPWSMFHIDNYHNFINTMANEYEVEITNYEDLNLFDNVEIQKYNAIFIDEIQDYNYNWQMMIKKYFLVKNGELVVFGDEKQNIYGTTLDQWDINTIIEDEEWKTLNESYRLSTVISELALSYFEKYLKRRYKKLEFSTQQELSLETGYIGDVHANFIDLEPFCDFIYQYIHEQKITYNDVVILGRHIKTLREIEYIFRTKYHLQLTKTFETKETFELLNRKFHKQPWILNDKLQQVRKNEKIAFQMNRGTMKISTIHSFKGWEAENVFLLLENPFGQDEDAVDEELIYTGITRSKSKLLFLNLEITKYQSFLHQNREIVNEIIK
ncbi:UvrD-like helicase family protein [Ureibacillus xyleni]|uniref:UvrD-like helicase family protein n=1 Tax=Ureibacillus xyleni TaxID=614648 RepID=A0A285SXS8_9BACL|nr:UvrD-helicase domain-containing protein [Ureibacillus xyleni]SOC11391.1 UvrD-like helicase family protein [Ureibacillus xyleni]